MGRKGKDRKGQEKAMPTENRARNKPRYEIVLDILLVVSQIGLFATIISSTCISSDLLEETRASNEISNGLLKEAQKNNERLNEEFELTIQPHVYGALINRTAYLAWYKTESPEPLQGGFTDQERLAKSDGGIYGYFSVFNPTLNTALKISAFVFGKKGGDFGEGLYGPTYFHNYLRPNETQTMVLIKYPFDDKALKGRLTEFYCEDEYDLIIDSDILSTGSEDNYFVVFYRDIRGNLYYTKTTWEYNKELDMIIHIDTTSEKLTS